jgi:hypothetical protein
MILSIKADNFQRLSGHLFELADLTLLAGQNGSGKSSLFRILALMRQSLEATGGLRDLLLNGPLIRLGRAADILGAWPDDMEFRLTLATGGGTWEGVWRADNPGVSRLIASGLPVVHGQPEVEKALMTVIFPEAAGGSGFRAEDRLGPSDPVPPALAAPRAPAVVRDQLPVLAESILPLLGAPGRAGGPPLHEPLDPDGGLDRGLGLARTAISAKPGSLVLLNHPETHLHPTSQSTTGQFLARAAAGGLRLLVETHSVHVLNGARRAVKDKELGHQAAVLYFHHVDGRSGALDAMRIAFDDKGGLSAWPEGLFDQLGYDHAALMDW